MQETETPDASRKRRGLRWSRRERIIALASVLALTALFMARCGGGTSGSASDIAKQRNLSDCSGDLIPDAVAAECLASAQALQGHVLAWLKAHRPDLLTG